MWKDHCSSSSTTFDWFSSGGGGGGNISSWLGDVKHGSNGIVSFSWFGLVDICWCSVGVTNDEDGDDCKFESNWTKKIKI